MKSGNRPRQPRKPFRFDGKKNRNQSPGSDRDRLQSREKPFRTSEKREKKFRTGKPVKKTLTKAKIVKPGELDLVRLNKYIANSGICSRREADDLIRAGVIKVNGKVVTELGTKVHPSDKIQYGDQAISNEKKRYLLLNKPKGVVTTTKDPHAKNTVMELIAGACKERIYPVGRLDRNTTGLLLFTNDGDLAKKLTHPGHKVKKLYHVALDQNLKKADMLKIAAGVELEDGLVQVDGIAYDQDATSKKEIGIELHSGKNRVVRRLFESFGYKVTKLDRVLFAGLTKKNLPRGKWRLLEEKEVNLLKML